MSESKKRGWMLLAVGLAVLVLSVRIVLESPIGIIAGVCAGFLIGCAAMYLDPPTGLWTEREQR